MDIASACLVGKRCRYDGQSRQDTHIKKLYDQGKVMAVCPECLAKLAIPRCPSEIVGGDGSVVLRGKAKVMAKNGSDRTEEFLQGAKRTLEIAIKQGADCAYLKSKSPSCGCGKIYDGSFSAKLKNGDGVTAALLKQNGIKVKQV